MRFKVQSLEWISFQFSRFFSLFLQIPSQSDRVAQGRLKGFCLNREKHRGLSLKSFETHQNFRTIDSRIFQSSLTFYETRICTIEPSLIAVQRNCRDKLVKEKKKKITSKPKRKRESHNSRVWKSSKRAQFLSPRNSIELPFCGTQRGTTQNRIRINGIP